MTQPRGRQPHPRGPERDPATDTSRTGRCQREPTTGENSGEAVGYPGLGFDPTPGEPSAVAAALDGLDETRLLLADCAADVPLDPAGWTGAAADAYRSNVATLPAALTDTGTSMSTAVRVLTTWFGRLVANKRETERLDALAGRLRAALANAPEPARAELNAELDRTIAAAVRLRARHLRQAVEAALSLDGSPLPGWPEPVVDGVAHTSGEVGDWTAYLAQFGSAATPDDTALPDLPELVELPLLDPSTTPAAVVAVPLDPVLPLRPIEDVRTPATALPEPRPVAATARRTLPGDTVPAAAATMRTGTRRRPDSPHRTTGDRPGNDSPRPTDRNAPSRAEVAPGRSANPVTGPPVARPDQPGPRADLDRVDTASATASTAEVTRQPVAEPPRPTVPEPPDSSRSTGIAEPGRTAGPAAGGEPGRFGGAEPGQRPAATPPATAAPQKTVQPGAGPDDAALLLTTSAMLGALLDLDADTVAQPTGRLGTYLLCAGDRQVLVLTEEQDTARGAVEIRRTIYLPVA